MNRKILMETSDNVFTRTKYLRSIKQYREENRPHIRRMRPGSIVGSDEKFLEKLKLEMHLVVILF